MRYKDIKIGTQLIFGFSSMLFFVILLGVISYRQSEQIHHQTELMYNNHLQVRIAVGDLKADILTMRIGIRDLMLAINEQEKRVAIQLIETSGDDALSKIDTINNRYLGPRSDVIELQKAFTAWRIARQENVRLALINNNEQVKENLQPDSFVGKARDQLMNKISVIEKFSTDKSISLYKESNILKDTLRFQLIIFVSVLVIISLIISILLLQNIRKSIAILINASRRFLSGDLSARSTIDQNNEFGDLSKSFNTMVESIQMKNELDEKFANLASLMLSEYDAKKFFQTTLQTLAKDTGSQMAAIYLLNKEKTSFEHFESIGTDAAVKQRFGAASFEGEFGSVLTTRKPQYIKNIASDTRFVFNTVNGKFIPKEIISIPILANNEIVAIVSLATISNYSTTSIEFIDRILVTLSARIEGILAYHRIIDILAKMEDQNAELEAQKTELCEQSIVLKQKNIELEEQKNQLDEVSRLKTNFLSNMSHELRTPLNSVIALSGVLNRRLAKMIPEVEYSYLEVIERNGKHLLSLINNILDISRIEAGREEIDIAWFDMNKLILEVNAMILPQAQQKGIILNENLINADLQMVSDMNKCRHILQNLIANAVKFTDVGKVEVTVKQDVESVIIEVADTGIGIPPQHISHIFDEFRQADSSTSRRFGGTGLGLTIAQKYADLLGGNIQVHSIENQGSIFILTLPLKYKNEKEITGDM